MSKFQERENKMIMETDVETFINDVKDICEYAKANNQLQFCNVIQIQ